MRQKPYPRLTVQNAEWAAAVYLVMCKSKRLIWRTVEIDDYNAKSYKRTLQALWRLHDNNIVGQRSVGDAGNIWWLKEREIHYKVGEQ